MIQPIPKPARLWRGIDISHHQKDIDPEPVLIHTDYIYLKTSGGDRIPYVDQKFDRNYALLTGKKPLGGYHFFNPYNQIDEQLGLILRITNREWQLPYSLDFEYPTRGGTDAITICLRFYNSLMNEIIKRNHPLKEVGLCAYTAAWWWNSRYLGEAVNHIRWWIATYGNLPILPKGVTNIIGWQTSASGRFIGIQGPVDTDVMAVSELGVVNVAQRVEHSGDMLRDVVGGVT
jgi:GH25 family lysozyme M1 (1,4-beta-N-acetylmuramidase)